MSPSPLALLLLLTSTCMGCYSTWDIAPSELKALDGYRAPLGRMIRDKSGAAVRVDASTELRFRAFTTKEELHARFDSIDVPTDRPAQLFGVLHEDGRQVWVDLRQIGDVTARRGFVNIVTGVLSGAVAAAALTEGITDLGVRSALSDH